MRRARTRRGIPTQQREGDRAVAAPPEVVLGDPPRLLRPYVGDVQRRIALAEHDAVVATSLLPLVVAWSRPGRPGDRFGYGAGGSLERLPELAMAA